MEWELKQRIAGAAEDGWHPTDSDYDEISKVNGANVKAADDGVELPIFVGGVVLLIGSGHEDVRVAYVKRQQDVEQGTVAVKKGGAFSKGSFVAKGISAKPDLVTRLVTEFSDKRILALPRRSSRPC